MATMQEAVITRDVQVLYRKVSVPKPEPGDVLIEVHVSGSNPKDWKTYLRENDDDFPVNMGDDIAGVVSEVGEGVTEFKPGDRVFAFHRIRGLHGSWARFAIAPASLTAHIPSKVSFEAAATIPLAAITAALANYRTLHLPLPWAGAPADSKLPYLVYGGSSAVGAFAIKLARLSGVHPIISVAGAGSEFVRGLLDEGRGDAVVDYRGKAAEEIEREIGEKLEAAGVEGGVKGLNNVFDAVTTGISADVCLGLLAKADGEKNFASAMPPTKGMDSVPKDVSWGIPISPSVFGSIAPFPDDPYAQDLGFVSMRAFAKWMGEGRLAPHPYKVYDGGLQALPRLLEDLKGGKASAEKFVFRPNQS